MLALIALATLATAWNAQISVSSLAPNLAAVEEPSNFGRAMQDQLAAGQLAVSPSLAKAVRMSARYDPLGSSAALLGALDSREAGNVDQALVLLEVARRRDPRNRITRALSLEVFLQAGMVREASTEIVALDQLVPDAQSVLLPILASLIEQPATQAAAIAAIPEGSRLRLELAQTVAREQLGPELIIALQDAPIRQEIDETYRRRIASLILPYVQSNNIDAANLLSRYFYPGAERSSDLLTDAQFSGYPGPPFGWELDSRQGGFAELSDNQLWVSHYGRSAWTVARQVMHLPSGSYQLSYSVAEGSLGQPNLAWRVDCLASGAQLLDLPLNPAPTFGLTPTDHFTVPDHDCALQRLVLAARVDDTPSTKRVAFSAVEITQVGGSQ